MNLRLYTIAVLVSVLPLSVLAGSSGISFNKQDFVSAERVLKDGKTLVTVKLSKSGKAKLKKLNGKSVGQEVHAEMGGVSSDFTLKEPIHGEGMEMGPYSSDEAERVVTVINQN